MAQYFSDPDDDPLTYEATSSNTHVATVTVAESTAIIAAENLGRADIQVTARDPEGETATQPFSVTVEAPAFILSGTVSDRRRNGPVLAGAVVQLDNGQQESTRTDRDGRYRFGNVSGTVTVTASAEPSHVTETVEVTMEADRTIDFTLEHTGIPPYAGTVWITPDILTPSDPSSLGSVTYVGRRMREFWDRPAETWVTIDVYLFNVRYSRRQVEFQLHPHFGSREAARSEVDTYAPALGRLPAVLLTGAKEVEISAVDALWQGNDVEGIFHIYTGQGEELIRNGFLEEVLFHEGGHVSLDRDHKNSAGWRAAQQADGVFISEYGRDYPDDEVVRRTRSGPVRVALLARRAGARRENVPGRHQRHHCRVRSQRRLLVALRAAVSGGKQPACSCHRFSTMPRVDAPSLMRVVVDPERGLRLGISPA